MNLNDVTWSDLRRLAWLPTLRLAAARGILSGIIVELLIFSFAPQQLAIGGAQQVLFVLLFPVLFAACFPVIFILLFGLKAAFTMSNIQILALVSSGFYRAIGLAVMLGDPIIFIINQKNPGIFNLMDFAILNPKPFIVVTHLP